MSPALQHIIDDFALLDGWEDRYGYMIDLAKNLPAMDDNLKIPAHIAKGCMSQVWCVPVHKDDGKFYFLADSDAILVRGLIAILYAAFNGQEKQNVTVTDIDAVFRQLGLEQNLSPNRRNGFFAMVGVLKAYAS